MRDTTYIGPRRNLRFRRLLLLALAIWTLFQGYARAEAPARSGGQYGLARMLSRAAPGLANRLPVTAPDKGIDTKSGYPYYQGARIAADAPGSASASAPAPGSFAAARAGLTLPGTKSFAASSPPPAFQALPPAVQAPASAPAAAGAFAPPVAPAIPVAAAEAKPWAPAPPSPATEASALPANVNGLRAPASSGAVAVVKSSVSALQEEIDAIENQMATRAAEQASAPPPAAYAQVPTPVAEPRDPASSRLLAGLKSDEGEPRARIDAYRQELAIAEFAADRPAMKGDNTPMYVSASANGETDVTTQVSRRIRGGVPAASIRPTPISRPITSPYEYEHNPKRNPEDDAPGGVYHVGGR